MKNTLSELCSNNWHCREFLDISHICRKVRQSSLFSLQFQQAYNLNTRNFSENVKHKIVLFHLYFLLRGRVWRNFALKIRIIDLILKLKGVILWMNEQTSSSRTNFHNSESTSWRSYSRICVMLYIYSNLWAPKIRDPSQQPPARYYYLWL